MDTDHLMRAREVQGVKSNSGQPFGDEGRLRVRISVDVAEDRRNRTDATRSTGRAFTFSVDPAGSIRQDVIDDAGRTARQLVARAIDSHLRSED